MRVFSRILFCLGLCLCNTGVSRAAEDQVRPNIVVLIGDDIDRNSLGTWGGEIKTPHLDQLAADGLRLDRVYANVAMCAPFRQELYSGRVCWRTRAIPNHSRSVEGTQSIPHYLRPLGYQVGLAGKSHVGPQSAYPFDKLGGDMDKKLDNNALLLEKATAYATAARDEQKPFCIYIAANDGHGPYTTGDPSQYDASALTVPDDAIDTKEYRAELVAHYAEVTNLDKLLGDVRAMLKREGLADNTLVMYCSEQGSAFPFGKWTCYDDGLSSGVVMALPGLIPAGEVCDEICWMADFTPTFIEAAGGSVDPADFDGRSQWQNFTNPNESQAIHEYAYGAFTNCNIIDNRDRIFPIRSIRDSRYSLIWCPLGGGEDITSNTTLTKALVMLDGTPAKQPNTASSWVRKMQAVGRPRQEKLVNRLHQRPEWALYDRQTDPHELKNLIDDADSAEVADRLKNALSAWLEKWGDADPVATEKSFVKGVEKRQK